MIPEGAIPEGAEQEIYFKVCKDNNFMPPLDADKGKFLHRAIVLGFKVTVTKLIKIHFTIKIFYLDGHPILYFDQQNG